MENSTAPATARDLMKEIQSLLAEREEARTQLQRLPLQKKGREAEFGKKSAAVTEAKDALKRLKMDTDKLELDLKTNDRKLKDLKAKLNLCREPKEFAAIQTEIKNLGDSSSALEEQIFASIGQQEEAAAHNAVLEAELAKAKEELAKFVELVDYKIQKMNDTVKILETKLVECEGKLEPELAALYKRLLQSKGAQAVAGCENGYCLQCNIEQTPQAKSDLDANKIIKCSSCAALLYRA